MSHTDPLPTPIHSDILRNGPPFFVVGSDRSGSTMLRLMLNEHSRLHVPRESHFLRDLMDRLPLSSPLDEGALFVAPRMISEHPRWKDWEISGHELREAIMSLSEPTLGELIGRVFQISCRRAKKSRWGDKTPPYVKEISRLHRVFPGAKFVHIIRDARDVCLSQRRAWHHTWHHSAELWSQMVRAGIEQGRSIGRDSYLEVAYEDLVRHSGPTLRRICAFLDEEYEPRMLEFHRAAALNIAPWEKHLHAKTVRPPQESDAFRWRREMSWIQVALVEAAAGPTMDLVGQQRLYRRLLVIFPALLERLIRAMRPLRRRLQRMIPNSRRRWP